MKATGTQADVKALESLAGQKEVITKVSGRMINATKERCAWLMVAYIKVSS